MPPGRAAHAEPAQLDAWPELLDRHPRRLVGAGRNAVHEDVHVRLDETRSRREDEDADKERRDRVSARVALVSRDESHEHCGGAGQVPGEMKRAGGERRACVPARRANGHERTARVDGNDEGDHQEREPGDVQVAGAGDQARQRRPCDRKRNRHEDRGLGERG
jgi:hypothetical protein